MESWIENNGNIDLLHEKKMYKFVPCGKFDEAFIGWVDKKEREVFFIDFNYYDIQKLGNVYSHQINAWLFFQITHYSELHVSAVDS